MPMYFPVPFFPRTRKNKREVPHDTTLLSTFDFEPVAYDWQELERNLLWSN
jgi:hypothetical protein